MLLFEQIVFSPSSLSIHINNFIKLRIFPVVNFSYSWALDHRNFLSQDLQKEPSTSLSICTMGGNSEDDAKNQVCYEGELWVWAGISDEDNQGQSQLNGLMVKPVLNTWFKVCTLTQSLCFLETGSRFMQA